MEATLESLLADRFGEAAARVDAPVTPMLARILARRSDARWARRSVALQRPVCLVQIGFPAGKHNQTDGCREARTRITASRWSLSRLP